MAAAKRGILSRDHGLLILCIVWLFLFLIVADSINVVKKDKEKDKTEKVKNKIGKSVLDYSEADIEKLLDQWDENDDDQEDDDKYDDDDPRKPSPKMSQLDPSKIKDDPMAFIKMSKKGKTIMMFASIAGNPSKKTTDTISLRWQSSLHNAHLEVQRYIVADDRILFLLKDGSMAWDVKDFLVTQPECKVVEFENQKFPGVGASPADSIKRKSEL